MYNEDLLLFGSWVSTNRHLRKSAEARQIDSARSTRLLCSKLLVRTHRMKHSTGRFPYKKAAKIKKGPPRSWDAAPVGARVPWPPTFLDIP